MQCIYDMFEGLGKRPSGDPKERAGQIFRKIDINGDGDLTENEFIKGCSDDKVERRDIKLLNQRLIFLLRKWWSFSILSLLPSRAAARMMNVIHFLHIQLFIPNSNIQLFPPNKNLLLVRQRCPQKYLQENVRNHKSGHTMGDKSWTISVGNLNIVKDGKGQQGWQNCQLWKR